MSASAGLVRRLGLGDAVVIGLGSMVGAGVFAAFAPAAQAAGNGLLIGLAVAAFVAFCNASSSAQLAAAYPHSGGSYHYGRMRLGPWWGFFAGWSFVIGKTASCAAMAMTFAAYAAPAGWERPVAVTAVLALAAVNSFGITRTAALTRVIIVVVLLCLAVVAAAGFGGAASDGALSDGLLADGWYGILQSAGLLFFAFAGYARITTLGEEVRDPARTIPAAITIALALAVLIYAVVAVALLTSIGADRVAASNAPLATMAEASGWRALAPVVSIGGASASLGALLALIAGIGRTAMAMAREGDLPRWLGVIHPRWRVPRRAEFALAVVIVVLVLVVDLRGAIAFSSFGVLLYYLVANLAAFGQPAEQRRYPRVFAAAGTVACVLLVVTLPLGGIIAGIAVVLAGLAYRLILRSLATRSG